MAQAIGRQLGRKILYTWLVAGCCLAMSASNAGDQIPEVATADAARWNAMLDSLRDLPVRILDRLPEADRADPELVAEASMLALSALVSSGISALAADVEHPVFLPLNGPFFGTGQPNSDTVYRFAHIDPTGTYRLRGKMGTVRMASVGLHGTVPGDIGYRANSRPGPAKASYDLASLPVDENGNFDVILSPARPADYDGSWWKLEPETGKLMLRLVSSDWKNEVDPTIAVERLDKEVRRARWSGGEIEARLKRVAQAANFVAPMLVADHSRLRSEGNINKFRPHTANRGMLPGQRYYYGAYDLKADQALVLEAKVPETCRYWSVLLTNHLYETHDWLNNQSSLNDSQADVGRDGILRVVVSRQDPGVYNWLDTASYPRGVVQGRWTHCDSAPVPTSKVVPVADVLKYFPGDVTTVTPAQRERIIRERRLAYGLRPLW